MQKTKLRQYARLIAQKGANIQKNQPVIINSELDQPEFIEILVDECYKAGALSVDVKWTHQPLTKLNVRHKSQKELSNVFDWEIEQIKHYKNTLPVMIYILSEDPDGLKGVNQVKMSKALQIRRKAFKPYRDEMDNKYQWCIAAVPSIKWAKKLFPDLSKKQAVEKLWHAILSCSRADTDPISQWNEHNKNIQEKCKYLNSLELEYLEYKSSNGTNLKVGLIDGTEFLGGVGTTTKGIEYNANIPTEEVFISPKKGVAEGIVYSTKPLSYQSQLIENFSLTFKDGKVVKYEAEKNQDLLGKLIEMDENAAYLGECALVTYNSPINESGLLFYNTLFDENACCHLALGAGFNNCVKGYEQKTFEECKQMGINDSIVHEDFMIGSEDLSIVGITKSGKKIEIFKDGVWAF